MKFDPHVTWPSLMGMLYFEDWTGFVKRGRVKRGLVRRGFVKRRLVKRGF